MDSPESTLYTDDIVPGILIGENVIPTTIEAPLQNGTPETCTEPEVDTTVAPAPVMMGEVGAGNLPPGGILAIDNEIWFDEILMPTKGRRSRILPKSRSDTVCRQCPGSPSFATKSAFRKHKKQTHVSSSPQCPMCPARIPKQPLARHLKRVHGITDTLIETTLLAVPTPKSISGAVELLHKESHDVENTTVPKTNETKSERVYCQEYDCGRGFSSKTYLESHTRYFHSRQPKRAAEDQETYRPPTSMITPTHAEEQGDDHDPHPSTGTNVPNLGGEYQGIDSAAQKPQENAIESSPPIQGSVDRCAKTTPPAAEILPLHCRMCRAPPTLTTQPTVTTCGHLFCFGCITQHVSSTSRCPMCNSSLLLFSLFKLDL